MSSTLQYDIGHGANLLYKQQMRLLGWVNHPRNAKMAPIDGMQSRYASSQSPRRPIRVFYWTERERWASKTL